MMTSTGSTLPQTGTPILQPFVLQFTIRLQSPVQVDLHDSRSGQLQVQFAGAGTVLQLGASTCAGQYMPHFDFIHQQKGASAASGPPGKATGWLSQRLTGHPPKGDPLHAVPGQPGHAMGPKPSRRMERISAEMKPQSMMDFPEANAFNWLSKNGGMLAQQGTGLNGKRITIIGGGQTGLFMAIHLAKAGGNVCVLEADSTSQGRAETHVFCDGSKAPLGMMRYGRGQAIFGHLVQELGYVMKSHFPDPGVVPTLIHYDDQTREWNDIQTVPEGLEKVHKHFSDFLLNGWGGLEGWENIRTFLQTEQSDRAAQATQAWIDRFRDATFGSAFREIFEDVWNDDDFRSFDTIGVGSGGFGVLNDVSLFAVMRVIVNGFEDKQCSIGKFNGYEVIDAAPDDMIEALSEHAIECGVQLYMDTPVTSVTHNGQFHEVRTSTGIAMGADIVVCTTTLHALIRIQGLSSLLGDVYSSSENLPADVRSGKLFALIDASDIPEIHEPDFPRMLLSRLITPQIYMLPGKTPCKCVLLMWYGWQKAYDDLASMSNADLMEECIRVAKKVVEGTKYETSWNNILNNVVEISAIRWQGHNWAGSAFSIPDPQDNEKLRDASFLWGNGGEIKGPTFLASADLQGAGGWNEGGYMQGAVVLSAILKKYGILHKAHIAPCNLLKKETLNFG